MIDLLVNILIIGYGLWILILIVGWHQTETPRPTKVLELPITLLIPARNEANTIARLIESISEQHYDLNLVEIIIIDDHSEDGTHKKAKAALEEHFLNGRVLRLQQSSGKQAAISLGVEHASNEWLICTDADCLVKPYWLTLMVTAIDQWPADLLIGPVQMQQGTSIGARLQALEFSSLISSAGAMCGWNTPVFGNGANIAYRKSDFEALGGYEESKHVSGDDVFLIHRFKKAGKKIRFLRHSEAIVLTEPNKSMRDFLHQRLRWSSKAKHYQDKTTLLTGLGVVIVNLALLSGLVLALLYPEYRFSLLRLWVVKLLFDMILLLNVLPFFQQRKLILYAPLLSLLYPFYAIGIAFLSLTLPFQWKGRIVRS